MAQKTPRMSTILLLAVLFPFCSSLVSTHRGRVGKRLDAHRGLHRALSVHRGGSTQLHSTTLSTANAFWKANPFVAAAVVAGTKATMADIVAQRSQQKSEENVSEKLDRRRTLSFLLYGSLYQGCVQELIYNNFYTHMFGSATTPAVVVKKVLFDAIFHNALVCIPMAYAVKALVFKYSVVKGVRQYIDDVRNHGLLVKYYALWLPVNTMIFTIIPPHLRITVMATVSFFWMIILSKILSSRSTED